MKYMTISKIILFAIILIAIAACKPRHIPASKGGYTYNGIYFGAHFSDTYKKGIRDGCSTSKGVYTKSHWMFKNKKDYENGWFLGRNRCRHLLKIDKNGDLII